MPSFALGGVRRQTALLWRPWLPVGIGLALLCLPSFYALSQTTWTTEENGHGPIILAVFIWLVWQQREILLVHDDAVVNSNWKSERIVGWLGVVGGALAFVVGRSQSIDTLEVAALLPLLAGSVLLMRGWSALRALWFPLFFLLFLIPLPGLIVEAVTGALKQQVSHVVESLLYGFGYPIARNGVVLTIGRYQLLVADACSGLNSMFSLSALGLLYLNQMRYKRWTHVGPMLASILPIAFLANVVRVAALVLITYHYGDEAGQGFAHTAAGMVLFVVALLLLLGVDSLLRWSGALARRVGWRRSWGRG